MSGRTPWRKLRHKNHVYTPSGESATGPRFEGGGHYSVVQEVCVAAPYGLAIPEGLEVGSEFTVTARLLVAGIREEQIDVTDPGGPSRWLPGHVTVSAVAKEWEAA